MNPDVAYLEHIIRGLVESPSGVAIERTTDEMGVLLSVTVPKRDMGKVIGKDGITSKAVRHIMNCYGYGAKSKISVKFLEPNY